METINIIMLIVGLIFALTPIKLSLNFRTYLSFHDRTNLLLTIVLVVGRLAGLALAGVSLFT